MRLIALHASIALLVAATGCNNQPQPATNTTPPADTTRNDDSGVEHPQSVTEPQTLADYVFLKSELPDEFKPNIDQKFLDSLKMKDSPGTVGDKSMLKSLGATDAFAASYGHFNSCSIALLVMQMESFDKIEAITPKLSSRPPSFVEMNTDAFKPTIIYILKRNNVAVMLSLNLPQRSAQELLGEHRKTFMSLLGNYIERLQLTPVWKSPFLRTIEDIDAIAEWPLPNAIYSIKGDVVEFNVNAKRHPQFQRFTDSVFGNHDSGLRSTINVGDSVPEFTVVFAGSVTKHPFERIRQASAFGSDAYVVFRTEVPNTFPTTLQGWSRLTRDEKADIVHWKSNPIAGAYSLSGSVILVADRAFVERAPNLQVRCGPSEINKDYRVRAIPFLEPTSVPGIYATPINMEHLPCRRARAGVRGKDDEISEVDVAVHIFGQDPENTDELVEGLLITFVK
ncbi:hypothetical protein Pan241w_18160 [Gimesia alba]|uniref:Lipoprotein n=1 Tax=Gimesia alba TaxID=2527973 RepID=A0A517RD34_9PLAN|nr:hypothetical protein [Gimesia alba]QDT41753.1 hypothetical protein Pan241w_18160 [Gimesia alba]